MIFLGLIDIPWWILTIMPIALYILYTTKDYDYFKKQGLPYFKPLPVFGTFISLYRKGMIQYDLDTQQQFKGSSVVGDFTFCSPRCIVFDADFLSQMMVKDFPTFVNRMTLLTGSAMDDKHLAALSDDEWRYARQEMSPAFSSGKLKKMKTVILTCAKSLVKNLDKAAEKDGNFIVKDYTGAYTMDVIASTAFGVRVNSQADPNNPIVKHAKDMFVMPRYKRLLHSFFPGFTSFLISLGFSFSLIKKDVSNFYREFINQAIKIREDEVDNSRVDFLQLMINARRGNNIHGKDEDSDEEENFESRRTRKGLSDDEISANAMLFFGAGYESSATTLQLFLYNMAKHPEIQERLAEEIKEVIGEEENIEYTKLSELPYMEQCINENLRIYPPLVRVNRVAGKDVTINNVRIRKGMVMMVPVYAIHHDPLKWPEPETFDPDRFSAENTKDRHPFHFLPFGQGPRKCIGMRLGLLEMKIAIIYMMRAFKFSTCDQTVDQLKFTRRHHLVTDTEIVLKIERRQY